MRVDRLAREVFSSHLPGFFLWVSRRLLLELREQKSDFFAAEFLKAPLFHIPLAFGQFCPQPVQFHLINEFFIALP